MKHCAKCREMQPLQNYYFTNGTAWADCKLCSSHAIKYAPDEKSKKKAIVRISKNFVTEESK